MSDIDKIKGWQPPSEGGTFLKLDDGDEFKIRITSLPVIFENEFKKGEKIDISTRFGFVIWNHDIGKPQVWIANAATYGQQISTLLEDEEYGDWRGYDVKLKRTGELSQTRYNIRPGVKRYELEDEQLKACENIDIIDLIKKSDGSSKVMWLSEYRELEEEAKEGKKPNPAKISNKAESKEPEEEDTVIEDIGDEPINLNDIPF